MSGGRENGVKAAASASTLRPPRPRSPRRLAAAVSGRPCRGAVAGLATLVEILSSGSSCLRGGPPSSVHRHFLYILNFCACCRQGCAPYDLFSYQTRITSLLDRYSTVLLYTVFLLSLCWLVVGGKGAQGTHHASGTVHFAIAGCLLRVYIQLNNQEQKSTDGAPACRD